MDTSCVPQELRLYLPLLLEVLTESPVMRDGSKNTSSTHIHSPNHHWKAQELYNRKNCEIFLHAIAYGPNL